MKTTQTTEVKTNDLRHSILAHDPEGNPMYIKIRLNDECKNGHQDFAITCDIYEKGKPKTDRYFIAGGCCHDEIVKAMPELKTFVDLHLCDWEGIPMYAVENGFYHLKNGFNNTKPEDKKFKDEFCEYYRMTPEQFDIISTSKNQLQYALYLQNLGILAQWKAEALAAIAKLENMTGKVFVNDSVKTQYHAPTPEQLKEESEKQKNGYYTPEAEAIRELNKIHEEIEKLNKEEEKKLNEISEEYEVKRRVLLIGGKSALNNCIYYTHSRTLAFNWRRYDRISNELVNRIMQEIKLPDGVKIENKDHATTN